MSYQRALPHVDPEADQGPLRRGFLRLASTKAVVVLEAALPARLTVWRLAPLLMRLTGGRFAWLVPVPVGLIETRDLRNGRLHRRVVIYFHDGDRVTVIPSKSGLPDDPFWYQNALADPHVLFEAEAFVAEPVRDEASRARLWRLADRFYPPGVTYRRRAAQSGRTIPLLQLVAQGSS